MVIDEEQLGGLAEAAGIETVEAILSAFWDSTEQLSEGLVSAVRAQDRDEILRLGHALKGTSANVGASGLAEVARQMEVAAKGDDVSSADALLSDLMTSIEDTRAAMQQLIAKYSEPSAQSAAQ